MRYKRRYLHDFLSSPPKHFRAILITGPRRSGKSTLSKELLKDWGGNTYITFDTPSEQARFASDPEGFLRSVRTPAVLDEVQNVPELFNYLKKIIDEAPDAPCEYILTGGQQFQMMGHVTESLAGRILIHQLLPFSGAEVREEERSLLEQNLNTLLAGEQSFARPEKLLSKAEVLSLLTKGGFPPVSNLSSEPEIHEWFDSYVQTYIQRDIRALANLQNLAVFSRFVSLVAGRTAQIINYSELGKDVQVNYKTSQHYLSLLTASYLWASLPPYFHADSEKRLSKRPKGMFTDTGLALFLTGASALGLERNPLFGAMFETFVFSELLKLSAAFSKRVTFLHFRAGEAHEVDLVLEVGNRLIPVEVKASGTLDKSWGKGIAVFKEVAKLPKNSPGYVVSLSQEMTPLGSGVFSLPLQFFL